jgi:hypothetical protein
VIRRAVELKPGIPNRISVNVGGSQQNAQQQAGQQNDGAQNQPQQQVDG